MATIQELRKKAEEQGNLKTTEEQKVIDEDNAIRIEPANPQEVYVPLYNPNYVYGPWWYPAYPPYYWYYPPGAVITGGYISFGTGFFVGIGISSWSWFDWHRHRIHVDDHKAERFHRYGSRGRGIDRPFWRHDPGHRRGVAYRDTSTSVRFGSRWSGRPLVSPETRGYPAGGVERRSLGLSPRTIERREGAAPQVRTGRERVQTPRTIERREGTAPQVRTGRERIQSDTGRWNLFRGIGSGNSERRASERGGISSQGLGRTRQSGDAVRQGGGVRGGGGSPGRSGGSGARGGGGSSVCPLLFGFLKQQRQRHQLVWCDVMGI